MPDPICFEISRTVLPHVATRARRPVNSTRLHAVVALTILFCLSGATPGAAGVFMQLRERPGSLQLTGDFFFEGSTPISASTSSGDGFQSGNISYDGIGLHASIYKDHPFNSETRFGVWAILRYEDLQITSEDGAPFVTGFVNLELEGSSVIQAPNMFGRRVGYEINPGVSTATSADSASVSRTISSFGESSNSNGFLSGWDGNGSISVSVPVTFSTTATEFLQLDFIILVDALVPGGLPGSVDVNFADTLRFTDPSNLITFTSGLNPTINSTTGEIVDNAIVIPEPATFSMVVLGFALLGLRRNRGRRGS